MFLTKCMYIELKYENNGERKLTDHERKGTTMHKLKKSNREELDINFKLNYGGS